MLDKVSNKSAEDWNSWWLLVAWLIAAGSTLAALFIGEIVGQTPCNLCWFQRVFMFPLAIVLGIAAFRLDVGIRIYALPLVAIGAAIAAFHSLVYFGLIDEGITPCARDGPSCSGADMTIFGGVPLPLVSLLAFIAIGGSLALCRPGVFK
ncbi:disulfide bond formation protein B [Georhizobium profundi]|jgi:disulfide bond formation protein DsbB|uniref:Disulfide bond formation protein B n=2 Tax=Hyphomicrobiales TaxID=356 RepID=A0A3Q8XL16_9HYPH|nr:MULTISPECIES: disulfide bond formation protein B [Hyphomicrobiales]AZN70033.1 disulfide bond formation protein B [Georhizobium profundi]MCO6390003.1 disulfide bond formation protein B [Aliihoeflea aestuarii]MDF1598994.1 disulfide bond formation protein B [Mesorhizobium sp. YIM 152430]TYR29516.1 disulfide bond formation protein B [Mesorhizobium microcysteis]